jgi:hypothetical protein
MAISLNSQIIGERSKRKGVVINKPDLNEMESFSLDDLNYTHQRDYFKSGIKACQNEGLTFSEGWLFQLIFYYGGVDTFPFPNGR